MNIHPCDIITGRKVCVLANLKDRTLAGFKSQGMVLCAVSADHTAIKLLDPPANAVGNITVSSMCSWQHTLTVNSLIRLHIPIRTVTTPPTSLTNKSYYNQLTHYSTFPTAGERITFPGFSGEPASSSAMAKKKILEKLAPQVCIHVIT